MKIEINFKNIWAKIKLFWQRLGTYKGDVLLLLIAAYMWLNLNSLLQRLDSTTADPPQEWAYNIVYSILSVVIGTIVAKSVMHFVAPTMNKTLEQEFYLKWSVLKPIYQVLVSLFFYLCLFWAFIRVVTMMN